MTKGIKIILLISSLISIFSFIFSLLANVLVESIIRAVVVFVISFLILSGATKVLRYITKSDTNIRQQAGISADEQNIDKQQQVSQNANPIEESMKGGHIDLVTPEEEQFQPFRPQEVEQAR